MTVSKHETIDAYILVTSRFNTYLHL